MKKINVASHLGLALALALHPFMWITPASASAELSDAPGCSLEERDAAQAGGWLKYNLNQMYDPDAVPDHVDIAQGNYYQLEAYSLEETTFRIKYKDKIGHTILTIGNTEQEYTLASFELYLGEDIINAGNDQKKTICILIDDAVTTDSFADEENLPPVGWTGDIYNRGNSALIIMPKGPAPNSDEVKVTNFVWDMSDADSDDFPVEDSDLPAEEDHDFYIRTKNYHFGNLQKNSLFKSRITLGQEDFIIPVDGELVIEADVTLEFENYMSPRSLVFDPPPERSDTQHGGTLSIYLTRERAPGKLVIRTEQEKLKLQRLLLYVIHKAGTIYDKTWEENESFTLIEVADGLETEICFANIDCDRPGPSSFIAPNTYNNLPSLLVEIPADRKSLLLKKWGSKAFDSSKVNSSIVIENGYYPDLNRQIAAAEASNYFITEFFTYTLASTLPDNLPVPTTNIDRATEPEAENSQDSDPSGGSSAWSFNKDGTLRVTTSAKFGWRHASQLKGKTQNYRFQLDWRYLRFTGSLIGFYNQQNVDRLKIEFSSPTKQTEKLLGGLLYASYALPVKHLNIDFYLGSAFTPAAGVKYKIGLGGLNLNYRHGFDDQVSTDLAADFGISLMPAFVNGANNKNVRKLFVRGNARLQLAISTGQLLGESNLKLSIPLELGITRKFDFGGNTGEYYTVRVSTGLTTEFTASKNLIFSVGYSYTYSNNFNDTYRTSARDWPVLRYEFKMDQNLHLHSLKIQAQFQM